MCAVQLSFEQKSETNDWSVATLVQIFIGYAHCAVNVGSTIAFK